MGGIGGGLLALATGALQGANTARTENERRRSLAEQQKEQQVERWLRLATLPGVRVGTAPPGGPGDGAAGPPAPAMAPSLLAAAQQALAPAGPTPLAPNGGGSPLGPPAPPAARQPSDLISLGSYAVGGASVPLVFDPSQTRPAQAERTKAETQRTQRAIYAQLHAAHPEAYPHYVEGYDYGNEYRGVQADARLGARQQAGELAVAQRMESAAERRVREEREKEARDQAVKRAETRVANMLQAGTSRDQVALVMEKAFPDLPISYDDIVKIDRQVQSARHGRGAPAAPDAKAVKERRSAIEKQIGAGPTTTAQQDALDLLARGYTKQQILGALKGTPALTDVTRYLSLLRDEQ